MNHKFLMTLILCSLLIFSLFGCADGGINDTNVTPDDSVVYPDDDAGTPTKDGSYTVIEMEVTRGELTIYGKLYTPSNVADDMPAVILSHSAMLSSNSMQSYAERFAERGYIAYAFDFCGGSFSGKSSDENMTIFTEVADLKAAIDAVSQLDNVDTSQIYLFGTSQGGLVTALTANDCASRIAKIILLYPAFNIPEKVQGLTYNRLYDLVGYSEEFIATLQGYDAYEHIADFEKPVLIVHGTSDTTVDISYSQKAQTVYADCTLKTIEDANHGFNSENTLGLGKDYDDEVWEYIDEFLGD